jgi:hypothetical protein
VQPIVQVDEFLDLSLLDETFKQVLKDLAGKDNDRAFGRIVVHTKKIAIKRGPK